MALDRARELSRTQVQVGGGYNRNAVGLILVEAGRGQRPGAIYALISALDLEEVFGREPVTDFPGVGRRPPAGGGSRPPPASA